MKSPDIRRFGTGGKDRRYKIYVAAWWDTVYQEEWDGVPKKNWPEALEAFIKQCDLAKKAAERELRRVRCKK